MTLIIKKSKLSNTLPNHKRATIWRSSGFSFPDQHIWSNNFYSCWIPSLFKSIPPASFPISALSRFYSTSQWVSEVLWHHSRHTNNASAINSSWTDWFLFAGSHFRTTWNDISKYDGSLWRMSCTINTCSWNSIRITWWKYSSILFEW